MEAENASIFFSFVLMSHLISIGELLVDMTLAELSYVTHLFANDIQCMHHHAAGKDFDQVHSLTEEYYNEAKDLADFLAEKALMSGCGIDNFTCVNQYIDSSVWTPIEAVPYDIDTFVNTFNYIGNRWLSCFAEGEIDCNASTKVAILEELNWWESEINYKNASKMLQTSSDEPNMYFDVVDSVVY